MKTINSESTDQFIVKKSKFIGIATPVTSMDVALERVNQAWTDHDNARHIAWAVKVNNRVRMNDDGEPSGTAGMPILNVLQHQGLDNITILVVRYFGGIKLGAGGLTRAYSHAASIAIQRAEFIEFVPVKTIELVFQFSKEAQVRRVIQQHNGIVLNTAYDNECHLFVEITEKNSAEVINNLIDTCHGNIKTISN